MHRPSLVFVALLALLAPATADAKKKKPKAPSKAVVQRLMREQYIGEDPQLYPGTRYALKVTALKRGASRKGDYLTDGVPANTNTRVFPMKITMDYVVCYQDGTARRDKIVDKQVLFKDDVGDWTNRLQDQLFRTSPTVDKLAACPL